MTHKEMDALMGRRVAVSAVLERTYEDPDEPHSHWKRKTWIPEDVSSAHVGWVVGVRRLNNGISRYLGWDDGWEWKTTSTVWCVLVALNARKKPLRVPMDGFEVLS